MAVRLPAGSVLAGGVWPYGTKERDMADQCFMSGFEKGLPFPIEEGVTQTHGHMTETKAERERDSDTERNTETERDRQTERDRHSDRETETERGRYTERHRETKRDRER